jgi:hypothetical protein
MSITVTEDQEALPAIFEHCRTVYQEMEREAHLVEVGDYGQEEVKQLVWEGHLTKLFARLHLSVPYYTSVTRELKRMGCIAQKRRGGGNAPSQWLILTEPTEELFRQDNKASGRASKRATKVEMLEQQVRDLTTVVSKIQSDYDTIITILQEKESA